MFSSISTCLAKSIFTFCSQFSYIFSLLSSSFFSQLFSYDESTHNLAVLHQTGCYWQPVSTTSLLGEPKVICVSRSPFDQYAELKIHKGFTSSGSFIRWHKHLTKMNKFYANFLTQWIFKGTPFSFHGC